MASSDKLGNRGIVTMQNILCVHSTVFLLELNKTFLPILKQFLSLLNLFHAIVFFFLTFHEHQKD